MKRWFSIILVLLFATAAFGQVTAVPDPGAVKLIPLPQVDPQKPFWYDATPMFHEMAQEAASKFQPVKHGKKKDGIPVGGEETFWAMNVATSQFVQVTAVLRKIGKTCYLYVEKGQEIDDSTVDSLVGQFDNKIYPVDTGTFGSEPKPGIDGDDRVTLLVLDIQDGWAPGKGYVGGYFFPLNEYSTKDFPQSNEREMIYLDCNPSDPKSLFYMGIVAHEFQHLIHFNQDARETKFVNEGNSQYAFHACGFGIPSQILSFERNPDWCLTNFKNTIEDYGAVYLFFYYLYTKYPGVAMPTSLAITSDPGRSIEGIDSALVRAGVPTTFAQVFADWSIANILADPGINAGKYWYDSNHPLRVLSKTVVPGLDTAVIQEKIQGWANDYFRSYCEPFWTPAQPTIADSIEISVGKPGIVIWSIDEGVAAPQALWPPNSRELEPGKSVLTQVAGEGFTFKVGPFTDTPIKRLNVSIFNKDLVSIDHAQIPVSGEQAPLLPIQGRLSFEFKGKKGVFGPKNAFTIRLVTEGEKTLVADVPVDKDYVAKIDIAGLGAAVKRATVVVGNVSDKELSYELTPVFTAAPTFKALLAGIERGFQLIALVKPQVPAKKTLEPLYLSAVTGFGDLNVRAAELLDPAKTPAAGENAKILAELGSKPAFQDLLKLVAQKQSFAGSHGESWDPKVIETLGPLFKVEPVIQNGAGVETLGDDSDTSHTNIVYLHGKKQELIHSLTHLKIDPQFVEGQILQMYKLLQLSLNLPNIPLPDGLGIVDYDEKAAQVYIDNLKNNGANDTEKESLRRLTVYENLIEKVYDNNLIMAEDFGTCTYEGIRLVLTGRKTLLSIAGGLQDVPIIGTLVQKVVRVIIGKSLGIVVRTVNLLSGKMKPPYNTIVPIVVQLGANVAARFLHVEVQESDKWMWGWAAKTASKYAFVSIPKIGYVAKTQEFVDAGTAQALKNDFGATTADANKAVLDDQDPATANSVFEKFITQIVKKHDFTMKEIEVAKIAKAVAQIAGYASLIDPTNISKVVGIVAATFSGGALVHGMVNTAIQFSHAKERLTEGLHLSWHPETPLPETKSVSTRLPVPTDKLGGQLKVLATLKSDYRETAERVKAAFQKKDLPALTALTQQLVAFEENLEPTEKLCALSCQASLSTTSREGELDGLVDQAVQADLGRCELLAAVLPAAAGVLPDSDLEAKADSAVLASERYFSEVSRILGKDKTDEMTPTVGVSQLQIRQEGPGWIVTAVVTLLSPKPSEVSFTLYGAPDTQVTAAPKPRTLSPWDSVEIQWTVQGPSTSAGHPVSVAASAGDDVPGFEMGILP